MLSQSVVKRYGFVVPSQFPGKKAFGRFGDEFLATRHRMLNSWLRGLIECKVVFILVISFHIVENAVFFPCNLRVWWSSVVVPAWAAGAACGPVNVAMLFE
jgi:hypothetical protein